ncbi:hypothetical protein D9Q98_000688 [Chlorella vulgaris]|uniref:ubiquitinyl hydrolase 1 n=1 Tax=Chlorella vulgaris TaxID=3077 RepID=A0A9D4TYU1_CHLVU|nr:hypothetical protein D9Q98_000688 [Chlorella vulgaris]
MDAEPRFHERQHLQRCALHSLNNLFQDTTCSRAELDAIASQLAPGLLQLPFLHPHRTLYLGNWDVNVLELALQRHGKELHWVDSRDLSFAALDLQACWGLLVNVRCDGAVARWLGGRHWFALKQFGHGLRRQWWNLDSTLLAPQLVASSCAGAAADSLSGVAETREGAVTASRGCSGSAVDGQEDAEAAPSTDMAALRKFLAQQVVDRDAKVFCVTDPQPGLQPVPHDAAA